MPEDAEFKGYHERIIQNIQIKTDNVLYQMESYYSKSEGETYTAELPGHLVNTQFGSELKAFVYMMYFDCRVTEHKIAEDEEINLKELKPLINKLIADDVPQFKKIVDFLGLCWIHEERHYEKMIPIVPYHQELLKKVISQIWDYYKELKLYKENPNEEDKIRLNIEFDDIFTQQTGYDALNERVRLTFNKKDELLLVLDHSEIPLHNNLSEIGERTVVIKRKISGGVRGEAGKISWENGLTILSTCKKHAINFYSYVRDIFAGCSNRLHLSDLIFEKNYTINNIQNIELECVVKVV